jgi:hypothetical protein
MGFQLNSGVINQLIDRRFLTDVTIHRRLFHHSWARVVIDWDEGPLEGDKPSEGLTPTADLGAAMLNTDLALNWIGDDQTESTPCFSGYVASVAACREIARSQVVIDCVSHSKRTDLIPRFRVWQECTLLDVCQHIASREPLVSISSDAQGILGQVTIDLSVQYGETDFEYLRRMLHAWGVPLSTDDQSGKVVIGSPTVGGHGPFPALDWHWERITLEGHLVPLDAKSRNIGTGATGIAKQYAGRFDQGLSRAGSEYHPRLDDDHYNERTWIAERVFDSTFDADITVYRIAWPGHAFDYGPGATLDFGGNRYMVREVNLRGCPNEDTVMQEFVLQDYLAPVQPNRRKAHWPSRTLWAHVTKNNDEDPQQRGRIQVEFDLEQLDSTGSRHCWLPTVTQYGGLKGQSSTSGFLSLPEVGEHVLVQFLGDWDSDAVVTGSVREYARGGFIYDPHNTKRWQTPSGNQVTLTTRGDTDILRLKCKDKLIFEGKISGSKQSVTVDLCDSTEDRIHFEKGSGPTRLDVLCSGEIYMHADQKMHLDAGEIQLTSSTGNVNIKAAANVDVDGASGVNIDGAMVKLNSPPAMPHWKLKALKAEPDNTTEGAKGSARTRSKPPKWA